MLSAAGIMLALSPLLTVGGLFALAEWRDRRRAMARARQIRLTDAIHLAAAERLPRPIRFLTFDPSQIPVALGLGFDVVST